MKNEIELPLKAKHFIDTRFTSNCNCAISKAAKDLFKTNDVMEHVDRLYIEKIEYVHKDYGGNDFHADKIKAESETDIETIIRVIILNKKD